MKNLKIFISTIFIILLSSTNTFPQWLKDGLPFLASEYTESIMKLIPDNEGNVYVIWFSMNAGFKIWVSKIDTAGYRMWETDSVKVSLFPEQQRGFDAVPDGEGGIVIPWRDTRDEQGGGDIYAQRIDKQGNRVWNDYGVPVIISPDFQDESRMCLLNDGTFIVTCEDERAGFNKFQIFGQRIDKNGLMLWDSSGIAISDYPHGRHGYQKMIASDSSNCIVVWSEHEKDWNIIAQKIDKNGNKLWDSIGVAVANLPYDQGEFGNFAICSDGAGGVVIAWEDDRLYWEKDIYIQRVDSSGQCFWQDNGIRQPHSGYDPVITMANGNIIYFWEEGKLYGQKISMNGEFLFGTNGKEISEYPAIATKPVVTNSDTTIIVAWERLYTGQITDIYAQKIDYNGNKLWDDKDIPICVQEQNQYNIEICPDHLGGAYIAWFDERDMLIGNQWDAYIQRVYPGGLPGGITSIKNKKCILPLKPILYQNYPNPFNDCTSIRFLMPKPSEISLSIFNSTGQKVTTIINNKNMKGGAHKIIWNGENQQGRKVSSGVYFYRLKTADLKITKKMIFVQ